MFYHLDVVLFTSVPDHQFFVISYRAEDILMMKMPGYILHNTGLKIPLDCGSKEVTYCVHCRFPWR